MDYNRPYCALQPPAPLQVLDVGTGSGCIAVTLAADLRNSAVTAWDISGDALLIARENVHQWQVRVELKMEDALHPSASAMQQKFDVIVSNPPISVTENEQRWREMYLHMNQKQRSSFLMMTHYASIGNRRVWCAGSVADGVLYLRLIHCI